MRRAGALEMLSVLLLVVLAGGCGTFASKATGPNNTQAFGAGLGHPYEGVTGDIGSLKCIWERSIPEHVALRALVTIALVIDTPLSLVADTLALPFDIVAAPQRSRIDPEDCDAIGFPNR